MRRRPCQPGASRPGSGRYGYLPYLGRTGRRVYQHALARGAGGANAGQHRDPVDYWYPDLDVESRSDGRRRRHRGQSGRVGTGIA